MHIYTLMKMSQRNELSQLKEVSVKNYKQYNCN